MFVEKWKISCAACGNSIELYPSQVRNKIKEGKRTFYCSKKCSAGSYYLSMQVKGTNKVWNIMCAGCGKNIEKPMHEFNNKLGNGGRIFFCSKKCADDGAGISYYAVRDSELPLIIERNREAASKINNKKYYENNKEKLLKKSTIFQKENREKHNEYNRRTKVNYRRKVLEHYGLKCECCGEEIYEFLTIDHINGGGNKHKKEIGKKVIYKWLIDNDFPEGYRTLCYNCNCSIGHYGYCPHQLLKN